MAGQQQGRQRGKNPATSGANPPRENDAGGNQRAVSYMPNSGVFSQTLGNIHILNTLVAFGLAYLYIMSPERFLEHFDGKKHLGYWALLRCWGPVHVFSGILSLASVLSKDYSITVYSGWCNMIFWGLCTAIHSRTTHLALFQRQYAQILLSLDYSFFIVFAISVIGSTVWHGHPETGGQRAGNRGMFLSQVSLLFVILMGVASLSAVFAPQRVVQFVTGHAHAAPAELQKFILNTVSAFFLPGFAVFVGIVSGLDTFRGVASAGSAVFSAGTAYTLYSGAPALRVLAWPIMPHQLALAATISFTFLFGVGLALARMRRQ